jgi:hypothetical protein
MNTGRIRNDIAATPWTTRVRFMASHPASYKPFWFAVTALGPTGESVYSDPVLARAA